MTQPMNNKINGIDVSDPNRTFNHVEFQKLGDGGRLWIYCHRTGGNKQKVEEIDIEEGGEGPSAQKPKGTTAGSKTWSWWLLWQRLTQGPRGQ